MAILGQEGGYMSRQEHGYFARQVDSCPGRKIVDTWLGSWIHGQVGGYMFRQMDTWLSRWIQG